MKREHSIDAAAALALIAVVAALYRKVTRLFWTYDDAYLLHIARVRGWREYFLNGEVWRSMPQHLFTPLVTATYDSERSIFGFDPHGWYFVHLAIFAAAIVAIYFALRLWLPPLFAFGGATLVALGAPAANLATELMLVHYLEAVILASLALIAYVRADRRGRFSVASPILYLAAMLAKEIAVPLVVLLFLFSRRRIWAHVAALALYLGWRIAMLHELLGGYGYTAPPARIIASLPRALASAFAGPRLAAGIALLVAIAIGVVLALRRNPLLTIVGLILAAGPIVPIAAHMEPRFAMTAWIWAATAFVAGLIALPPRAAYVLLAVALAAAIVVNRAAFRKEFTQSKRMSDEARVFLDLGPDSLLRKPAIPPAALGELQWLKQDELRRAAGAGWFYDDFFLCAGGGVGKRIWQFDGHDVREAKVDAAPYCASIRNDAPLTTDFHYGDGAVSWKLGPYRDGTYSLVIANGIQAFDVPPEDSFKIALPAISLRVRYQSPQGWVTYSPEIALDFVHHPDTRWTR